MQQRAGTNASPGFELLWQGQVADRSALLGAIPELELEVPGRNACRTSLNRKRNEGMQNAYTTR
jgi:hypothetical protein